MRFLTSGESHGPSLNVIIDGCPSGVPITVAEINKDLERRRSSAGRGGRAAIETDEAEILSGVRDGRTLGSPICLEIRNKDWQNWQTVMNVEKAESDPLTKPRPGHADMAGVQKRGFKDIRNVLERSSARETAARVAAGAVAKALLKAFGSEIISHTTGIGDIEYKGRPPVPEDRDLLDASPTRTLDMKTGDAMAEAIRKAAEEGDTLGGVFEVIAYKVPSGLGDYTQWDLRLDALLAFAVMSIPAIKGVEFGSGFNLAKVMGSQSGDPLFYENEVRRSSNRMGGIEGGVSNGEPIVVRAAMKPIPTLKKGLPTFDIVTGEKATAFYERSDICAVPRAAVIGESMVAWVIADALIKKFGGDQLDDMMAAYHHYKNRITT